MRLLLLRSGYKMEERAGECSWGRQVSNLVVVGVQSDTGMPVSRAICAYAKFLSVVGIFGRDTRECAYAPLALPDYMLTRNGGPPFCHRSLGPKDPR